MPKQRKNKNPTNVRIPSMASKVGKPAKFATERPAPGKRVPARGNMSFPATRSID